MAFRKFETLVTYLKEIGISQYNVNAADFDPQAIKTSRVRPGTLGRIAQRLRGRRTPIGCAKKVAEIAGRPTAQHPHRQVMDEVQPDRLEAGETTPLALAARVLSGVR